MDKFKNMLKILTVVVAIGLLAACTGGESADIDIEPDKEIMVSAAASLTEAVTEISKNFQEKTGIEVVLNFLLQDPFKSRLKRAPQ